ncbi:MAG: HD domain-containing protein [Prevotellaceae bacterium]|nr:HD domain-containing protein [Prevotellaceae bacterium]MDY3856372.1 HD domain-containing protein [Bacteroidaceae bacterium]
MVELTPSQLRNALSDPIFVVLSTAADALQLPCYLIGGYVRDLFLKRESTDIDVVVVGHGIAMAKEVAKRLGRGAHISVFQRFGTAQVKWQGRELEFVGARRESYSPDSRKPHVEDGTLQDDLERRDFTINTLAISLNRETFGKLIDLFGGLQDMEDKMLRTPLDPLITFSDDPLRMMRCIRFATQLNFTIDDEAADAIRQDRERIRIISQERITTELNKIMLSPTPSIGFSYLDETGLLPLILPEIAALQGRETREGKGHKDIFQHTLQVLDNVSKKSTNLWLRWAALLHDVGKPRSKGWDPVQGWTFHNHNYIGARMVPDIFRRLKLPMGAEMKYVQKIVDLHMRPISLSDDIVTDSAVRRLLYDAGKDLEDLMLLCEADITSKNAARRRLYQQNFERVRHKMAVLEDNDRIRNFQPPVDGLEIMQTFGLGPSPVIGQLKQSIKEAILNGKIPNEHDAARQFMLDRAKALGLKPVETVKEKKA